MFESLLKIFEAGLSIWDTAQSRKYKESVLDLKLKRAKELEKEFPCYNSIDKWERQLLFLSELFCSEIKGQKTKDL